MIGRKQKVRLAVFLVVTSAILMAGLLVLLGVKLFSPRDHYFVRYTISLSGLETGAPVKFNGIRVGTVQDMRIDPQDVSATIVTLALKRGTPVKEDTRAVVNLTGITGLKYIELTGGTKESRLLRPGDFIKAGESLVQRLTGKAEAIAVKAEMALNRLVEALKKENRQKVLDTIRHADGLMVELRGLVRENRENMGKVVANLESATGHLAVLAERLSQELPPAIHAVRTLAENAGQALTTERLRRLVNQLEAAGRNLARATSTKPSSGLVRKLHRLLDTSNTLATDLYVTIRRSREDLYTSLSYMRDALENFSDFARMVRENPSVLLKGGQEPARELR